jgi:hypothetical protein
MVITLANGVNKYLNKEGILTAIVIEQNYQSDGIEFFTESNSSQQLGYMKRSAGYEVVPHKHKKVERLVQLTQEVLFIKSGSCRLDLYDAEDQLDISIVLNTGDVVLLAEGGHGLVMLEETEIIEVKQGPFSGDMDKTRFNPADKS